MSLLRYDVISSCWGLPLQLLDSLQGFANFVVFGAERDADVALAVGTEELTERVLHEARVFITPGFIFGSNGKRYIRKFSFTSLSQQTTLFSYLKN